MKDRTWRSTTSSSTVALIWAVSSLIHPSVAFRSVHHHGAPISKRRKRSHDCVLLDQRTLGSAGHTYCFLAAANENAEPAGENDTKPKRASKGKSTYKANSRSAKETITKGSVEKKQARKAQSTSKVNVKKKPLSSIKLPNKKYQSKKKSSSAKLKEPTQRNNQTAVDQDAMYIQFSRVFQRHVVYHKNTDGAGNIKSTPEVLQSFEFLDEATAKYPGVRVLAPKDLPFPPPTCSISFDEDCETERKRRSARDKDECETTIAGMGLTSLCELEYPFQNVSQVPGWVPVDANFTDALGYRYDQSYEAIQTLISLVLTPTNREWVSVMNLPRHYDRLDEKRFAMRGLTSAMILTNYARVMQLFSGLLGMEINDAEFAVCNFPQLCLYDSDELETMVRFLIAPLPPKDYVSVYLVADGGIGGSSVDWPRVASKGYGAGLTVKQAGEVVRVMPEVLALYYEDSLKPSISYMYNKLAMSTGPDYLQTTVATLRKILEGTTLSDTWFFSFLAYNGLTWSQIRILAAALKLLRNCILEPSWQITQQYDRVRKELKRYELDYLRQRLQIAPSDVQNMIKIHPRLSGYDACFNIKPTLNKLQQNFGLTSREMATVIQRMPPLIGMSTENIDDKVQWFMTSAGMTTEQCRSSLLKQPSLIQYSIANTLQPKLNFFTRELGVEQSLLPRIITTTPALMGYSLSENLRPKVIYLMKRCALDQYQLGVLVATSPSLLTLSIKGKIEPMLDRISLLLDVSGNVELGEIVMTAPRMLHQSISSLDGKFDLLAILLKSGEKASTILRNNPSLLQWSLKAFKERVDRYSNSDTDLLSSLQPFSNGRTKLVTHSDPKYKYNDAVIISTDSSFDAIDHICPDLSAAAKETGLSKSVIKSAIRDSACVQGIFFSSIDNHLSPGQELTVDPGAVPISIAVTSQIYPNDNKNYVRGQSRSGGVCLKVIDEGQDDYESIVEDFSNAAASSFALITNPYPASSNNILTIFPLLNASKNRCSLFSLWAALRVVETMLKKRRKGGDDREYDVKVFSDSNYALKLVQDKNRMLKLGSSFTYNKELLTSMGMNQAYSNIDILHPLVRSYSRINGQDEPVQSQNYKIDGVSLDFFHSIEIQGNELYALTSPLKRQAKYVAFWQTTKEL